MDMRPIKLVHGCDISLSGISVSHYQALFSGYVCCAMSVSRNLLNYTKWRRNGLSWST